MSSTQIPEWPPSTSTEQEQADLLHAARDWALSHALVYRPVQQQQQQDNTPFHTSVIHAPFALYPSPFPRQLFDLAVDIQTTYSELYARIATDFDFLEQVIGGNVSKVDSFQGELWKIAKAVREEGLVQVGLHFMLISQRAVSYFNRELLSLTLLCSFSDSHSLLLLKHTRSYTLRLFFVCFQNIHLGLFRSDYLLHVTAPGGPLELKQVEFNTISSSFGALSNKVTDLHR